MVASAAKTVKQYLGALPPDRRAAIEVVRKTILEHLPKGYEETIAYGMLGYVVPLKLYPKGYLGKKDVPLPYASLASQKNYMALYLMSIYGDKETEQWFVKAYKATGKKLDMGKSCIRFKTLEDLPLDVIGRAIAMTPAEKYIERYEAARSGRK
jgi:uncharacterized protein YdhG (YjbR/CyaY superfamily)